jgi:hypothetical protein
VSSPALDEHLCFVQGGEELHRQEFVAQLGVEALAIAVLPRAARLDEERLHANPAEPGAHIAGDELGAVVGANVLRRPVREEEMGQAVKHVIRIEFARHDDRQTAPRELVDHRQHAKPPAVLSAVLHEVVGPHVVGPLGHETGA